MIRKNVFSSLITAIDDRINDLKEELAQLREGLSSDTKNTSGDKHETSRAMNQLEQERVGKLLVQSEDMKSEVRRLAAIKPIDSVQIGSLLQLENDWYLIAVAFGKLCTDTGNVFVLSPASPIGNLLINKRIGETVLFNDRKMTIRSIAQ